jgi:hypothetical protein
MVMKNNLEDKGRIPPSFPSSRGSCRRSTWAEICWSQVYVPSLCLSEILVFKQEGFPYAPITQDLMRSESTFEDY